MTSAPSITATQAVLQVIVGFWLSRCVYIAAKLGLADLVQDGAKSPAELAALTGTHASSLSRVLRALASTGWLHEDDDGRFGPTALTAGLQSGIPGSLRALATTELGEEHYPAWGNLLFSVKSGELAFDDVFGMPNWQYWAGHPEHADVFNRAMSEMTAIIEPAVLSICDLSGAKTIVDIGGGRGTLMSSMLQAYPEARGIVLDLPHVIEQGRQLIAERGLQDRCELIAGDFFKAVPSGGDVYVLKWVIHDWTDAQSIAILKNCHAAMPPHSRLLLIEAPLPPRNEPSLHKLMDINMLVMTGGRERTEAEYRSLLEAAGFSLTRVTVTPLELAVLEATRR
jgi:cyclopropane fatty-acyl-phospholipid synthase-like methyltransferase